MRQINETQILGFCFRPLGDIGTALINSLTEDDAEKLRASLAALLVEEAQHGARGLVDMSALRVSVGSDFKSVLYKDSGAEGTRKIVAFSFRDAVVETTLPFLGVAVTVFTGKGTLPALVQLAGILKTLWSKLVVLKLPADKDAIELLEAIVRIRARNVAYGNDELPTNADLEKESALGSESIKLTLTRLKALAVIDAATWGDQIGDVTHLANRWKVKL